MPEAAGVEASVATVVVFGERERAEEKDMRCVAKWALALTGVLMPTLLSAQDSFFDSKGVSIRYVEQGSGDPVILVHGFSSNVETGWINTGVFSNLAKDYRVVALDLRGRGKSDKPTDAKAYGAEVARDVVRLLDHLKIERAHMVGYSMGANIVAKLLTTDPHRFITATLGGSAGRRNWTAEDDRAAEAEAWEFEKGTPFRSVILRTWPTDQPKPSEETIQRQSEDRIKRGNDPAPLAADVRGRHAVAVTDAELAAVRVPTLAIVGSEDAFLASVNAFKEIVPSVKVVVISGATHGGARGAAGHPEFVGAIRDFISQNQQKSSR